jgi:N-acetylglucosamine malate deacetylase 2
MRELASALAARLAGFRPACVISHSYEGGHPDHDAACLITQLACRRLDPVPTIVEMTSYHAGAGGEMIVGGFVGDPAAAVVVLDDVERSRRRAMLDCFVTQKQTLVSFRDVEHEAFRVAPAYDFTQPPHPGDLWYERHDWGMTGARWRSLAREAPAACQAG